jgi:hypothetical protein
MNFKGLRCTTQRKPFFLLARCYPKEEIQSQRPLVVSGLSLCELRTCSLGIKAKIIAVSSTSGLPDKYSVQQK